MKVWISILGLWVSVSAFAIPVQVAFAPDSNLSLTEAAILSAKSSILLNIYELTSPQIADALLNRIKAGKMVEILEEGNPVEGLSAAARGIQSELAQAMGVNKNNRLYEMKKMSSTRRYHFDHAKYAVIDDSSLLIGSENYSPTGNPIPGSVGNRGWEVLIHDAGISKQYAAVFLNDADPKYGDVTQLNTARFTDESFLSGSTADATALDSTQTLDAQSVELITSPDNSLARIIALLDSARSTVDIEQMTLDSKWKGAAQSPLVDEILKIAKRGVHVRVLLNDDSVFDHAGTPSVHKNSITADLLNQAAQAQRLPLVVKIADVKAMGVDYIHNKGMLVDGNVTLISSINWDENSFQNNREAAVALTGTQVNAYYEAIFSKDWSSSGGKFVEEKFFRDLNGSENEDCPQHLTATVKIGELQIKDSADGDFKSLQNKTFTEEFVQTPSEMNCVLVGKKDADKVSDRIYLQIRKNTHGETSIIFEAYTPTVSKLFSVRSKLKKEEVILGDHQGLVYDGSGPGREMLGQAVMSFK